MTPQRRLTPRDLRQGKDAGRAVHRRPQYTLRDHVGVEGNPAGRNRRTVWTIATQPYRGAHFATFPERLVEPCILAGTSQVGCCPSCGAPWRRAMQATPRTPDAGTWEPGCACDMDPEPAVVLDPFAGSGTTLAVAVVLGRRAIGIELNPDYIALVRQRCYRASVAQLGRAA